MRSHGHGDSRQGVRGMTRWQYIKGVIFRRQYKLLAAIDLLVEVHTRDGNDGYDWSIQMGATPDPWVSNKRYTDAWHTLRKAVGRRWT